MRNLIIGILIGATLTAAVGLAGSGDFRSDRQQKLDYYRQKQESFDLQRMRQNSDLNQLQNRQNRINRALSKSPC
jgi:hypothetical protein